jgi:tetrahydromethanopterin S-methyltransferase subunit G
VVVEARDEVLLVRLGKCIGVSIAFLHMVYVGWIISIISSFLEI